MYKITYDNLTNIYEIVNTNCFKKENILTDLNKHKLFINDVFDFNEETNKCIIKHSNTRINKNIPAILLLDKTYGRIKKKLLYRCICDDKRLPNFLIPYEKPYNFNKNVKKLYITIEFDHWDKEIPYGKITQNIGDINIINNFYEYILYTKSLNISIQKFNKTVIEKIKKETYDNIVDKITKNNNIEHRNKNDYFIFTIDSKKSTDLDDAISYTVRGNNKVVSVYISNVAILIDYLNIWSSFTNRISSIYLPDKKRSMLPNILSENLCSLRENENKLCFVLDIYYDKENNIYDNKISICNSFISKNFSYEDNISDEYNKIKEIIKVVGSKNQKDLVTKLMLYTNNYIATQLSIKKSGIFKALYQKDEEINIPKHVPDDIMRHIKVMRSNTSNYELYNEDKYKYNSTEHEFNVYMQVTSPIRRLVDTLNNIQLNMILCNYEMSPSAIDFYNKWTSDDRLEYINTSMRAIRKIQYKCQIVAQHEKNKLYNPDKTYKGYLYDRVEKPDDGKYQYMIYIKEINLSCTFTINKFIENYTEHDFKLYIFHHENTFKRKVKIQIIYQE